MNNNNIDNLKKILLKAHNIENTNGVALASELIKFEDKISDVENKIETLIEDVKKKDYILEFDKEGLKEELRGEKGKPGDKGDNYVLTDSDKDEIASKVVVPIVEKVVERVIEKTETIVEKPIITEVIKEVAVAEDVEQIIQKLESQVGDDRLDASAIKNLPEFIKDDKRIGFGSMLKEAPKDGRSYVRKNRAWVEQSGGSNWDKPFGDAVFTYDVDGNVETKTVGTTVLTFTYDIDGNVNTISDGTNTKTFSYDVGGNVTAIVYT